VPMQIKRPGNFSDFSSMNPGDAFIFRGADGRRQLAMKLHYPSGKRDVAVRFYEAEKDRPGSVLLSPNDSFTRNHTLLTLDGLEIVPTYPFDFVGLVELDESPVQVGWLGMAGNDVYLTCGMQTAGVYKVAAIDVLKGTLLDKVPVASWFQSYKISLSLTPTRSETLFEFSAVNREQSSSS
jgi:hypothetical protein